MTNDVFGNTTLTEEFGDHIYDLASVYIDKNHIVIIPDPAIGAVHMRQAVRPRVIDIVPRREEQAVEEEPDVQPVVPVRTVRGIVTSQAEDAAVRPAIITPSKPAIRTPCVAVPAAEIAATFCSALCTSTFTNTRTVTIAADPAVISAASPAIHPAIRTPINAAVISAVSPAISATLNVSGAAVSAAFYTIGTAVGPAVNPVRGTCAAPAVKTIGPAISAPFNIACAALAATVYPVSPTLCAAFRAALCAAFRAAFCRALCSAFGSALTPAFTAPNFAIRAACTTVTL